MSKAEENKSNIKVIGNMPDCELATFAINYAETMGAGSTIACSAIGCRFKVTNTITDLGRVIVLIGSCKGK